MNDLTQNNFRELFIAADVDAATTDGYEAMSVGEVAMFDVHGNRLSTSGGSFTDAATVDKAKFVKRLSDSGKNQFQVSDVINKNWVTSAKGSAYAAKQEQVSYVGFNGSAGALDVINDNIYQVRFVFDSLLISNYNGDYFKTLNYKSPVSGTTQEAIAKGLMDNAILSFAREEEAVVLPERVCDGASVALGTSVNDVVFTKGSKTISAADIDDDTGAGTALAVGDYIRVGTALTSPVYKITAIDDSANTATLDIPFQGESVTLADTALRQVEASAAAAADWGLKFTGISPEAQVGRFLPGVIRFEISLHSDNWSVTEVTDATGAYIGANTAEQIAAEEFIAIGNQGDHLRYGRDTFVARSEAEDIPYNSFFVQFRDESLHGTPTVISKKQVKVAYPDGASNDGWSKANDGLQATVNAFFGTSVSIT